ncbi:MAG: hypothetical protein ACJ73S_13590 [Mycobacteriales bacterium]
MRIPKVLRLAAVAAVVAGTVGTVALAAPGGAAADTVFTVYLDPAGSDGNDGLTPATAIRTLARAQAVLTAAAPQTDVEVRVKQGTYVAPTTSWHFIVPGHTISFMPVDYQYGDGIGDIAGRPVFRGDGTAGYWFSGGLPSGSTGGDTNLRFYYLQVERYSQGGLTIGGGTTTNSDGIRVPSTAGANHNTIFGMQFQYLGSKWSSAGFAYGGVDLVNSSDNVIRNNHFVHLENTGGDAGLLHGVYLAHNSSRNSVTGNQFSYITGVPMRTRNQSDTNDISGNTFTRAGATAFYSEWFCDSSCVADNPGHPRECSSHGNVFHDNDTVSGYDGTHLSWWYLQPGGNTYPGGTGCPSLGGEQRIKTYGNT